MTDFLLVAPVLVPLAGAVLLIAALARPKIAGWVAIATALIVLGLAFHTLLLVQREGIQATNLGDWPGPFGIVLVADLFSAATVVAASLTTLVSLAVVMLSQDLRQRKYIVPFMLFLLAGVNGAFMTGDIFNLFVFFEVTLLASYALMAIGAGRLQTEAAFKYVVINVIGSTFLLMGIGLLYGELGTLNMAHLAIRAESAENGAVVTAVGALLMAAFGIKAALIPFHFWLPGAYAQLPSGVAVFFGAVLTKVGVYSMIRVFTLVLGHDLEFVQPVLLTMAGFSIVLGALGAVSQRDIRSILTWDIVSQVGYMVMGLALFTTASVGAAIFFMLQYMPVKAALFSVAAAVERLRGTGRINQLGGLARAYPILAILFLIPAMSLGGVPPFSGFWGKLAILESALRLDSPAGYAIAGAALVGSLLTLFAMFRIWQWVFWGEGREDAEERAAPSMVYLYAVPIAIAASATVVLAVAAAGLQDITSEAARQLLDPTQYVDAVNLSLLE